MIVRSVRPVASIEREAIYWEHEGNRAIRVGNWKLVADGPQGKWELYNMEVDRAERNDLANQHPEKAKQLAYADLETTTSLKVSLPWVTQEFESTRELMGADYWRYGIASNEKELDLVMRYTHEQGLVKERMDFRGMFHPSTLAT